MKKFLLIPDSFKGTMSSREICDIMSGIIKTHYPEAETISIPVADGGEGSVDAFLTAIGGERVSLTVKGPYMEDISSFYGVLDGGKTAVIEMAAAAGLPLVGQRLHAEQTTTYGVGQLIADAIGRGVKKIIVGLGGSATNDFGAGAAAALGVRFLNSRGESFVPVGQTLSQVVDIKMDQLLPGVREAEIITMCDIDNPLYGPTGAAYVFGPQKGADPDMVVYLDKQLQAISQVVRRDLSIDVSALPGAGAAGGMGGGMAAFLGSRLQMGIETVLDTVRFDSLLEDADMVLTGEGKIDDQSLRGKVVIGIAKRTKPRNIPLVAIVGDIGDHVENAYDLGVSAILSINRVAVDFREAKKRSKDDLALTVDNLMRFLKALGK